MSPARNRIIIGDATKQLRELGSGSIDTVLTSPPYFRLRDYQIAGQLGLEPHVDQWIDNLRVVAAEVARVLTPTGSFWLNIGDTYASHRRQGASPRGLLLGPERLLLALHDDGWLVRNKIIWAKTNPMPTSARTRLATTYESLFLLTRSVNYFFDLDAVRLPHRSAAKPTRRRIPNRMERWRGPNACSDRGLHKLKAAGLPGHPLGKNPGDTWQFATSSFHGPHPATFPIPLAERAILAGCPEATCARCQRPWQRPLIRQLGATAIRGELTPGCACTAGSQPGLVLDPFFGAGTTGLAAARLHRDWLGIELSPGFAAVARRRLQEARAGPDTG